MRRIWPDCWARACNGHATVAPPRATRNSRRPTAMVICPAAKRDRAPVQRNITASRRTSGPPAAPVVPSATQLTTPSELATGSIYEVARRTTRIQRAPVLMRARFGFCANPDRQRSVRIPTGGFQNYGATRGALLGFDVFQLLLEFF